LTSASPIVVGIDGGGTYTRAVAADLAGNVLAAVQTGAASPNKTADAGDNVQRAIRAVVDRSGRGLADVAALVAGLAGLDQPEDRVWAEQFVAVPGLECPREVMNDAVVAHAGALASRPGVIAISGTGSIILGVTETGRQIRNYDFHHYAATAARHLAFDAVYRILAGPIEEPSRQLVDEVLVYWRVRDLEALRELGSRGFVEDRFERNRLFAALAPQVTGAAARGVPMACAVCDQAAETLAVGIRLVGRCLRDRPVSVALIGGVARDAYIHAAIDASLAHDSESAFQVVAPRFSCEIGAVLLALQRAGVSPDAAIERALLATDVREAEIV
jgi:glucosamine kinase